MLAVVAEGPEGEDAPAARDGLPWVDAIANVHNDARLARDSGIYDGHEAHGAVHHDGSNGSLEGSG